MKTLIWDLDETVIDSKHRTPYFNNGDLDLETYRKLQTWDFIKKDKLLPLAKVMKSMYKKGYNTVILTARELTKHDLHSLNFLGLKAHLVLSRNDITDTHRNMSDAEYKLKHLQLANIDLSNAIMYDDNKRVKRLLREFGLTVHCAHKTNKRLRTRNETRL